MPPEDGGSDWLGQINDYGGAWQRAGIGDPERAREGLKPPALFPYVGDREVYKCPLDSGDEGYETRAGGRLVEDISADEQGFSYTMNASLRANAAEWEDYPYGPEHRAWRWRRNHRAARR